HDDAKNPKVIQTVFKKGYRLIASVSFEGKATELGLSRPTLDKGGLQAGSRRTWSASRSRSLCSWPRQLLSARRVAFLHLHFYRPKWFLSPASKAVRSSRASHPMAVRSPLPGTEKTAITGTST